MPVPLVMIMIMIFVMAASVVMTMFAVTIAIAVLVSRRVLIVVPIVFDKVDPPAAGAIAPRRALGIFCELDLES